MGSIDSEGSNPRLGGLGKLQFFHLQVFIVTPLMAASLIVYQVETS